MFTATLSERAGPVGFLLVDSKASELKDPNNRLDNGYGNDDIVTVDTDATIRLVSEIGDARTEGPEN